MDAERTAAVPDLTGLRLDEARQKVPTCVDVEPTDAALAEDDGARRRAPIAGGVSAGERMIMT